MNRLLSALLILAMMVSCNWGGQDNGASGKVRIPYPILSEGNPAHVHLSWNDNIGSTYDIFRADASGKFVKCASVTGSEYMDFSIGKSDRSRKYTYNTS